ncbi:hypothetical protein [Streptomyces griseorubiginosus]|uniref:hypothetical protein n=1 Tax=Streptomyces griseorubiginosus TaxID=67304 RepID=UPI0033C51EB2
MRFSACAIAVSGGGWLGDFQGVDDLLARSLLLPRSHAPADVVPYEDGTDDDLLLWESYGYDAGDDRAARFHGR